MAESKWQRAFGTEGIQKRAFGRGFLDEGNFQGGQLDLEGIWKRAFGKGLLEEGKFLEGNWHAPRVVGLDNRYWKSSQTVKS